MSEPNIDEGLWDRIRDNEEHYSRLLSTPKQGDFRVTFSSPNCSDSLFDDMFNRGIDWSSLLTGEHIQITTNEDLERILRGGIGAGSMGFFGGRKTVPPEVFFDFEAPIDWDRRIGELHKALGLACPHARGPKGVEGVDGIPSERLAVIVNRSKNIPDWSKEILKFQSGDEEVTEITETHPVPRDDAALHMIGSMFQTYAPELRDVAKLVGSEEAIDTVLDAMGGSPYIENLDELTPEQIAIHNPPVKPVYRIPPRPEPKPRKEVSKRKSVAKAARKRAQAGRKKNRG